MEEKSPRRRPPRPVEIGMGPRSRTARSSRKSLSSPPESPREIIQDQNKAKTENIILSETAKSEGIHVHLPEPPAAEESIRPRRFSARQQFLNDIDGYLSRELSKASSDADRIYVYKRAFDFLESEFQLCRPLLDRIKKQYDETSAALLARKRELVADSSTIADAEDSYADFVTQMRKARNQEFKEMQIESEHLLDELTELRLQRSSLMKDLDKLKSQNAELTTLEKSQLENIADYNAKLQILQDDIKITERDTTEVRKNLISLEEKLEKTNTSTKDLENTHNQLLQKIEAMKQKKLEAEQRLSVAQSQLSESEKKLIEVDRNITSLERDKSNNIQKLQSMTERQNKVEDKMRSMLADIGIKDDNKTIAELIKMLAKDQNS